MDAVIRAVDGDERRADIVQRGFAVEPQFRFGQHDPTDPLFSTSPMP